MRSTLTFVFSIFVLCAAALSQQQYVIPQLGGITTMPNPPFRGQEFSFTVNGDGFDETTAVIFSGPGCLMGCPAEKIYMRSQNQISGAVRLPAGSFVIFARNGYGPGSSNTLTINVTDPGFD
jgi:hypothetical protein